MRPFKGDINHPLTPMEEATNVVMSSHRIAVEWGFAMVCNQWNFISFKRALKLGLSPVAAYYLFACFLTNCHTCLRGVNQTSEKYGLTPPQLEEYLLQPQPAAML